DSLLLLLIGTYEKQSGVAPFPPHRGVPARLGSPVTTPHQMPRQFADHFAQPSDCPHKRFLGWYFLVPQFLVQGRVELSQTARHGGGMHGENSLQDAPNRPGRRRLSGKPITDREE